MFELTAWAAEVAEVAHEAAPATGGGLSAIGIDLKSLIFQVVNFAVLLAVLRLFAYRPIVKLLEARRQKIEESLRVAQSLAHEKEQLQQQRARHLEQAQQEAGALLAESRSQAKALLEDASTKARAATKQIEAEAAARLAAEQQQMRQGLKVETLALVKRATEKVLRQKLDATSDAELMKKALQEVENV